MHAGRAQLCEFGPDEVDAIATYVEIENARIAADCPWRYPPTPYLHAMWMRFGWDGEPPRCFLVEVEGRPVGRADVNISGWDNLDLAWLDLVIHPGHRRRGHGAAALAALHDECRRIIRPLVGLDGWESDATLEFAGAAGYEEKSRSLNRQQDVGRSPEELHEALAVVAASINDAPLDDLEIDEVYSAQRVRDFEHAQIESGRRLLPGARAAPGDRRARRPHRCHRRHRGTRAR